MIEGLVSGKLFGRPERRTSAKTGNAFVIAKLRAAAGGDEAVFVSVIAFEPTAQAALLALDDGDAVALAGTLTPKAWIDREGEARPSLDLVAAQVLTAYFVKKKRDAVAAAAGDPPRPRTQDSAEFPEDSAWLAGGAA